MIKPGTDQILPDPHTKETGRVGGGVCWGGGGGVFFDVTTNDGAVGRCHIYTHARTLMSTNDYTLMHTRVIL